MTDTEQYLQKLAIAQIRTETTRDVLSIYLFGNKLHRLDVGRDYNYDFLVVVAPTIEELLTGSHKMQEHTYSFNVSSLDHKLTVHTKVLNTVSLLKKFSKGHVDIIDGFAKTPLYVDNRFSKIASSLYNRTSNAYQLMNKTQLMNQIIEQVMYQWNLFQLRKKSKDATLIELARLVTTAQRYMRYVYNIKATGSVTSWLNETSTPLKQELDTVTTAYKMNDYSVYDVQTEPFITELTDVLSRLNNEARQMYEWDMPHADSQGHERGIDNSFEEWIIFK